jgi:hypothetical protein
MHLYAIHRDTFKHKTQETRRECRKGYIGDMVLNNSSGAITI